LHNPRWLKQIEMSLRRETLPPKTLESYAHVRVNWLVAELTANLESIKTFKIEFFFCPKVTPNCRFRRTNNAIIKVII
jgi:hypothetical protein